MRVYEKLRQGVWSYNGDFHLVDSRQEGNGTRKVYRFKLVAVGGGSWSASGYLLWSAEGYPDVRERGRVATGRR